MTSDVSKIKFNQNFTTYQPAQAQESEQSGSIFNMNTETSPTYAYSVEKTTETEDVQSTKKTESTSKTEDIKNPELLAKAPSNKITVAGEEKQARIVVSLSENKLYLYDENGQAEEVHSVASGAAKTPTHKGLRIVSHIETYPYSSANGTKRQKNPKPYGPKILILNTVDAETGKSKGSNGEFIHGNSNESSIGKYASHGCMRMHNDQIVRMAEMVAPGSYVLIHD